MASEYDFKEMERKINALEKKLTSFEKNFDKSIQTIINASFNETEYGERALTNKINRIVNKAQNEINSSSNQLIYNIKSYAQQSLYDIKNVAEESYIYINGLNTILDYIEDLNYSYSKKEFIKAINIAKTLINKSKNLSIVNYALLVELESYENICLERENSILEEDYDICKEYYELCEKYAAGIHITSSRIYLFNSSYLMLKNALPNDEIYEICKLGLKIYRDIEQKNKNGLNLKYNELYNHGIKVFNDLSEKAFQSFDYLAVKKMLEDANYFNSVDIKNNFFNTQCLTPEQVFQYLKEFGERGDANSIEHAFTDSRILSVSVNRQEYFDYWFSYYDKYGWKYCELIIKDQKNRYTANSLIVDAIKNNYQKINNIGSISYDLYNDYYNFLLHQELIDLDQFIDSIFVINEMIELLITLKQYRENDSNLIKSINGFDNLIYGMVVKYSKICSYYNKDKIKKLNYLVNRSSLRLYDKPYRNKITKNKKELNLEKINKQVKLITAKDLKDIKKFFRIITISVSLGVLFLILIVVLIILKLNKK